MNAQRVLFEHMHVLGYLMFASEHAPGKPEEKQAEWLKLLLRTELYPLALTYIRFLNPAEYALVSALLAYASKARLVVMDLSGIEVPEALFTPFAALTREMRAAGKTVVLTNTSCDFIQRVCTHASFLMDGTIAAGGAVDALCAAYDLRILALEAPDARAALLALSAAFPDLRVEESETGVSVYGEGGAAKRCTIASAAAALEAARVPICAARAANPSLREAFREVRSRL